MGKDNRKREREREIQLKRAIGTELLTLDIQ